MPAFAISQRKPASPLSTTHLSLAAQLNGREQPTVAAICPNDRNVSDLSRELAARIVGPYLTTKWTLGVWLKEFVQANCRKVRQRAVLPYLPAVA